MTAAKKTTVKPATKTKAVTATNKPVTQKAVATKAVTPAVKNVAAQVDAILKNQGPVVVKAGKKVADKPAAAPKAGKGPSKMEEAIKVWDAMPGAERKDVIAAFIDKAKLTPAGANTYFALIKAKKAKAA